MKKIFRNIGNSKLKTILFMATLSLLLNIVDWLLGGLSLKRALLSTDPIFGAFLGYILWEMNNIFIDKKKAE
ncbi:MAG TPA: hypothetical protein VFD78_00750 [Chitinophagaceae bacterium]|nr:hypothetical protein [Chitinophagaceae bacterium]